MWSQHSGMLIISCMLQTYYYFSNCVGSPQRHCTSYIEYFLSTVINLFHIFIVPCIFSLAMPSNKINELAFESKLALSTIFSVFFNLFYNTIFL